MNCRPAPPRLPTIDDLQATVDVISIYDLRRRGALKPEWTFIDNPARHPAVARLVAARYRLQIHFKGRDIPQSVAIEWILTAVYDRPLFRCGCGRRALKLYPTAKAYVCRFCVMRGLPRYRASSKYRSPIGSAFARLLPMAVMAQSTRSCDRAFPASIQISSADLIVANLF